MRYTQSADPRDAFRVMPFLAGLDTYYPNFSEWYEGKVIPGIGSGADVLLLAWDNDRLAGVALGKRTPQETKLRCIRVAPPWQNSGVGLRLIERMFDVLDCETPHCTVAEELFHTYSRAFIQRYGFRLSDVTKGQYRPGKLEYAFNGAPC